MAADEKLVEELATAIHIAVDGPNCDCPLGARYELRVAAKAALDFLSDRLVPDGSKVREIPGVRMTWPDGKVEEFQSIQPGAAVAVVAHHREEIAAGLSRLASADLLSRKQITTPWVAVAPEPAQEAANGQH